MSAFKRVMEQIGEAIERDQKKWGGMTLGASGRLGLEEVRRAVSLEGSVGDQTQTPYGMYGTKTPGEVQKGRDAEGGVHGPAADEHASGAEPATAEVDRSGGAERDPVAEARRSASAQASRDAGADRGMG